MMTETTNSTETTEVLRLERETCSRCGGSGNYSYCQRFGTVCFKCGGKKQALTKRGAAANEYLIKLRSKPAREIQVGDMIMHDGHGIGKSCWTKVTEVRPGERGRDGGCYVNGEVIPPVIVVDTLACKYSTNGDQIFRVFVSREHEVETLKQAITYQNTLTKMGKPRKTK